jgi:Ca2+/Na+ antiporter
MDDVHNMTFTFILVIVGIIIISLSLFNSGDERKKRMSLRLDKWTFWMLIGLYTLVNVFLIWRAAH